MGHALKLFPSHRNHRQVFWTKPPQRPTTHYLSVPNVQGKKPVAIPTSCSCRSVLPPLVPSSPFKGEKIHTARRLPSRPSSPPPAREKERPSQLPRTRRLKALGHARHPQVEDAQLPGLSRGAGVELSPGGFLKWRLDLQTTRPQKGRWFFMG